jgi:ABC-2 type transport system permease protein
VLADVFNKTLWDQRRALVGWGIGLALTIGLMAAMWPSFRDMLTPELLASYPEPMRRLFDFEAMTTGAGFLNAELFSIVVPAMFVIYAIGRGARLVAGEEQDGTLELVVVSPVSRTRILVQKAFGLAAGVTILGLVVLAVTVLSSLAAGMGILVGHAAIGALAMVLLGIQHGWLALAVGAATGRRAVAVAVAGTAAVGSYLLHVVGALVEAMAPWQPLSPFTQAVGSGPVSGGLPLGFVWLALAAIVFLAAAVPLFDRRDLVTA